MQVACESAALSKAAPRRGLVARLTALSHLPGAARWVPLTLSITLCCCNASELFSERSAARQARAEVQPEPAANVGTVIPDPATRTERAPPEPHFPRAFQLTSMRGTAHSPYLNGNSIDAIRAAHRQGIEYVEVDLILTRDHELVTAHQDYVKGCGTLSRMNLNQVLGCRLAGGLKLGKLGDILELPFKSVFLDLKDTRGDDTERASRAVAEAARAVVEAGRARDAVLMLYETPPDFVAPIRQHRLRAGVKGYPEDGTQTLEMVRRAAALNFELVSVNAEHVTADIIAESARLSVWHLPWSTDASQASHWRALAGAGAGGLIVLHFDLAREQVLPHWVDARTLHL